MVKFYSTSSVFKFSWDQVASAFWQRYPNPYSKHVVTEDVVNRRLHEDKLYTTRLLTKTNPMPRWGERFVPGPRVVCVVEESVVDPNNRTVTTYTRNIGMQKVMSVEEKCVYRVNPDNEHHTVCDRSAWISSAVYGFGFAIQTFGKERFKSNVGKTMKGYEHVLEKLFSTDIPQVTQSQCSPKDKIKDTARKAAEVAKSKTRPILPNPTSCS